MAPLIRGGPDVRTQVCVPCGAHPQLEVKPRFTDDAGIAWKIDLDMHLQMLEQRFDNIW
jgi:hypothetical protein